MRRFSTGRSTTTEILSALKRSIGLRSEGEGASNLLTPTAPHAPASSTGTPPATTITSATTSTPAQSSSPGSVAIEGPLADKLRVQFESKLRHKGSADSAWDDYSVLLDSMLDKVNVSIVSHHFLFRSISSAAATDTNDIDRKAALLDKIVAKLGPRADSKELFVLAELFAKQRNVPKLRLLLDRAKLSTDDSIVQNVSSLLIETLVKTGDAAGALEDFRKMEHRPLASFVTLMRQLHANKCYSEVESLFSEIKALNLPVTPSVANYVMLIRSKQSDWPGVISVFDELTKNSNQPSNLLVALYCMAINAYGAEQNVDAIGNIFKSDPLVPHLLKLDANNHLAVTFLNHLTRRASFIPESKSLFEMLSSQNSADAHEYHNIIAMCCRFAESQPSLLNDALVYMQQMQYNNIKPRLVTFKAIISTFCKHCRKENSADYIHNLLLLHSDLKAAYSSATPQLNLMLINTLIANNKLHEAVTVFGPTITEFTDRHTESLNSHDANTNTSTTLAQESILYLRAATSAIRRLGSNKHNSTEKALFNDLRRLISETKALVSLFPGSAAFSDTTIEDFDVAYRVLIRSYSRHHDLPNILGAWNEYKDLDRVLKQPTTTPVKTSIADEDGAVMKTSSIADIVAIAISKLSPLSLEGFLLGINGTYKVSVRALITVSKELHAHGELVSTLMRLEKAWEHRRVYLLLKSCWESLEDGDHAAMFELKEGALLSREDVEEARAFGVEFGRTFSS
ncbi:hypothetical protein BCR33DRAFT_718127 [Rhizoclosmatium globosum]|uniref:Pentacotripeptide-repeat region of PRORP domain-containing protein n=1 Tax=Rhizoclosmatium globosum TaxID=329046 RepID=A0A1Y2C9C4_9FUNG|nr:hypothetical protein BCR33DRAFT_718127 [Rhizoclosmatium globosum]|eukprot:ORY42915.1 hypothetical protein BCR33DRAFT_718127 [Rhizoclosmatium globosum]